MKKIIFHATISVICFVILLSSHSCKSAGNIKTDSIYNTKENIVKKEHKTLVKAEEEIDEKSDAENLLEKISNLPQLKREFRGVWVASVSNINWPSKKNLSVEEQKREIQDILELCKINKLNAIILQVRPMADALYKSNYEPWSYFLTGTIGKAPSPYYDPLEYWIEEAHQKNIELHIWINPYRAHHSSKVKIPENSMVKKMPSAVVKLANGMYWFDPANPATQEHLIQVVRDLVSRYDIDGVHLDDYFYPYPEYNNNKDFPDDASWNSYINKGGKYDKAQWRRSNVNLIIKRLNTEIKKIKPYVKFGISPFGIYKSGTPEGIVGLSQYDVLYADAKLWLNEGWVDYFSPQLYWPTTSKRQNFEKLLKWWNSENTKKRHLWPGLNTVGIYAKDKPKEILTQIYICQDLFKEQAGEIHWSFAGLSNSKSMQQALQQAAYTEDAVSPAYPWIEIPQPASPSFTTEYKGNNLLIKWQLPDDKYIQNWVLYLKYDKWEYKIYPKNDFSSLIPLYKNNKKLEIIGLKAINRAGVEGNIGLREIKFQG